jgi:hypothetical protein
MRTDESRSLTHSNDPPRMIMRPKLRAVTETPESDARTKVARWIDRVAGDPAPGLTNLLVSVVVSLSVRDRSAHMLIPIAVTTNPSTRAPRPAPGGALFCGWSQSAGLDNERGSDEPRLRVRVQQ